jgi:hypothetical protein
MSRGGYRTYHTARARLLLESATPLDAADASSLRPGRHRVTVRELRFDARAGHRVAVLVGVAGRRAIVPASGLDAQIGDTVDVRPSRSRPAAIGRRHDSGSPRGRDPR